MPIDPNKITFSLEGLVVKVRHDGEFLGLVRKSGEVMYFVCDICGRLYLKHEQRGDNDRAAEAIAEFLNLNADRFIEANIDDTEVES